MTVVAAGALMMLTVASAVAQSPSRVPALDSANAARAAWNAAQRALRANDLESAQREAERAAAAWPAQGAYHWYRAVLAARRGDAPGVRDALGAYARVGLGRDLGDSAFNPYRSLPWFPGLAAEHDANRRPVAKSRVHMVLSDSTWFPEAVDHDARTGRTFVSSVRHRTVMEITRDGHERELWPRHQAGIGAILGVRVDPASDALWVTTAGIPQMWGFTPDDSLIAALLMVRRHDGRILRRWDIASGGPALPGDLAIGPNGDVYVTDSRNPVLHVLKRGATVLEQIRHPLFRSLQGIAPAPDGSAVYLADYSHGLLRVDLATGTVHRVGDPPASTTVGCDGIAWHDNAIIAIQNGYAPPRVMRFTLDAGGTRVVDARVLDRTRSWRTSRRSGRSSATNSSMSPTVGEVQLRLGKGGSAAEGDHADTPGTPGGAGAIARSDHPARSSGLVEPAVQAPGAFAASD